MTSATDYPKDVCPLDSIRHNLKHRTFAARDICRTRAQSGNYNRSSLDRANARTNERTSAQDILQQDEDKGIKDAQTTCHYKADNPSPIARPPARSFLLPVLLIDKPVVTRMRDVSGQWSG